MEKTDFRHITAEEISGMERIPRLNLINSITGFKPANLIGTVDPDGVTNLAIFSSVVHLGSDPPLIGCVVRPTTVSRHTYDNIRSSGCYTVNHVHPDFAERAHYTSAKFDAGVSEFEACGLTEDYIEGFPAPFVRESRLKIGLEFTEEIPIPSNGTILLVGTVRHILLPDAVIEEDGKLDFDALGTAAVTGLNQYHRAAEFERHPYARVGELPEFVKAGKKRPDQVVFDEETGKYDAALKPYSTNLGAPAIRPDDIGLWKHESAQKVSSHFRAKFDEIRDQYEDMVDQVRWNELVYNAKYSFEPVAGETYHLYTDSDGSHFLSLIGPGEWKRDYVASFTFRSDRMWERVGE